MGQSPKSRLPSLRAIQAEIKSIQSMQTWSTWQGYLWIGISFFHMLTTMVMFIPKTETSWLLAIETVVVGGMVLLLDLGIMHYSRVLHRAKASKTVVAGRILLTYTVAVMIEWVFNYSAMWPNRPGPDRLQPFFSWLICFLFASMVTLSIVNAPLLVELLERLLLPKLDELEQALAEQAELEKKELLAEKEREAELQRREERRLARRNPGTPRVTDVTPQRENTASESHKGTPELLPSPDPDLLLEEFGWSRADALAMLEKYGVTSPEHGVRLLKLAGKLPPGVPEEQVLFLFQSLLAPKGNGKSTISSKDTAAILQRLVETQTTVLKNGAELSRLCGWQGHSVGPDTLRRLVEEQVLVPTIDPLSGKTVYERL